MKRMMMNGRWPNDSSIITWARPWLRWRYLSKTSKQLTQNFLQQQTMTTVSQSIITLSRLQSMSIIYIAPIVEGWVWALVYEWLDVIGRREKVRFKMGFKSSKTVGWADMQRERIPITQCLWSRIRDRVLDWLWSRQPIERAEIMSASADAGLTKTTGSSDGLGIMACRPVRRRYADDGSSLPMEFVIIAPVFQLLGEDTQKAWETKEDLAQEGTARRSRWPHRMVRRTSLHYIWSSTGPVRYGTVNSQTVRRVVVITEGYRRIPKDAEGYRNIPKATEGYRKPAWKFNMEHSLLVVDRRPNSAKNIKACLVTS